MKKNDEKIEKFNVTFNAQNTLICGRDEDLLTVVSQELKKLNAKGNTVYITDPYLFPINCDMDYEDDLKTLLRNLEASKIIYCAGRIRNQSLYTAIQNDLQTQNIQMTFDARLTDCHDRFWFCLNTDKCMVFGTSLNGIGKKICRIDELKADEVAVLKAELKSRGIL